MSRQAVSTTRARDAVQLPAAQLDLLPGYSQACEMIEKAASVDEAKDIRDKADAFRLYARKARNHDMEYFAAEIRMRAERKAGELLIESKANRQRAGQGGDRRSKYQNGILLLPTLKELKLDPKDAAKWQRIAKLSPREFERRLARIRANGRPGSLDAVFSSDSDEWLTPPGILDSVVSVLGEIGLDPCSEPARANVPAGAHFTEKDDGLAQPWSGTVFANPPYSAADAFVEKLIASWKEGEVTQAIALLPSRTDRAWFRALVAVATVCFVTGRIKFNRADGESVSKGGAPFPSGIFYLGLRAGADRFAAEFGDFGPICQVRS